ncbi:hypothetical protein [Actinoallomurus soli]|uniref:hypothetical protein n=1 Tax=Actinoallomurus soli TaxID=2952535 RepID=UPI002091EA5C|nr:hypothetical protein [Actinoallomurus soli]MCO5974976.1 hypothetical protein [Actinoallomurus soli]
MGACPTPHREALEHALQALADAVTGLGLHVTLTGPLTLSVSGERPAPDEPGGDRLALLIEPAEPLTQSVTIESHDGRLWWCWVWTDPGRDGHESEPIRPVEEVQEVARRIHTVVALPSAT